MPSCANPCVLYPASVLCRGLGAQLNEGTQPGRGNPRIWNWISGVCDTGSMFLCPSLAATGEDGGSQPGGEGGSSNKGNGRSPDDWLDQLVRLVSQAAGDAGDAERALSQQAQSNLSRLRQWASENGWVRGPGSGPETYGVTNDAGQFEWRLKIKLEPSLRPGLQSGSAVPRFDARLAPGRYINPFTGEVGGRSVGTHIPLDFGF